MEMVGMLLLVLAAGHVMNAFIIWVTHYMLHQRILGIPLYQVHLGAHHRVDHVDEYVLDVSTVKEHLVWAGFTLAFSLLFLAVFPLWIAIVLIIELLISAACNYYLHDQYEIPHSRFEHYKWFQHGKASHILHHTYRPEKDSTVASEQHLGFRRSVNYCFGGPLTGTLMDRIFGTYLDANSKLAGRKATVASR